MLEADRKVLPSEAHVESADGRTDRESHRCDLDVGRLPPHMALGAATAVGFFAWVSWSLIEQLVVPDLGEWARQLSHLVRNFCALSLGMHVVRVIMQRKEVELSHLRTRFAQDACQQDSQLAPAIPSWLQVTLADAFPAEVERFKASTSGSPLR